jgi:hypothetical protein
MDVWLSLDTEANLMYTIICNSMNNCRSLHFNNQSQSYMSRMGEWKLGRRLYAKDPGIFNDL